MLSNCPIPTSITVVYVFAVINLTIFLNLSLAEANVLVVNERNKTVWEAPDRQATFGPELTEEGVWGHLVYVDGEGCNADDIPRAPQNDSDGWIAMIRRGGCEFDLKVYNAETRNYVAVIIHNVASNALLPMGPSSKGVEVSIPSVFIGETDASKIKFYELSLEYTVWINNQTEFNYWPLLKNFIIIACGAFASGLFIGLTVLVVRWIRAIRKRNRSRLPLAHLKKIPVRKYKKGDLYDMCAICLDEYNEGDKLRILPCSHAYHQYCIDPWLTTKKRFCPICKRKVLPRNDLNSSSDSSDESNGESENTALLGATASSSNNSTRGGGTFSNSGLPGAVARDVHGVEYGEISSDDDEYSTNHTYQSSVEIHQVLRHPETLITLADDADSLTSGDTESADDDDNQGACGGVDNQAFNVVTDHFGSANWQGNVNAVAEDLEEYKPLMEEAVAMQSGATESSPRERDVIV